MTTKTKITETYVCEECSNKVQDIVEIEGGIFCVDCTESFKDDGSVSSCEDCGETIWIDNLNYVTDREVYVCSHCAENYYSCARCSRWFADTSELSDEICGACEEEGRVRVQHRHFDMFCTDFISKKTSGKTIKSLRPFGIELEFVNKKAENIIAMSKEISKSFGLEHDGSIRGNNGIEIVSPILAGKRGEDCIKELCEKAIKNGFEVNPTCGLHVHLSAPEFSLYSKYKTDYFSGKLLNEIIKEKKIPTVISKNVYDAIRDKTRYSHENTLESIQEIINTLRTDLCNPLISYSSRNLKGEFGINKYVVKKTITIDGNKINYYFFAKDSEVKTFNEAGVKIRKIERDLMKANDTFYFPTAKQMEKAVAETMGKDWKKVLAFSAEIDKNDLVLDRTGVNPTKNLKTLLYLYTAFNDVFLAMLPKSRRVNNGFCQKLYNSFSLNDILSLNTYENIETFWYKPRNFMEKEGMKNNKYDNSRYHGVNLHSLFSKKDGTVEIRWHASTMNYKSILYWVALHQYILDSIANNNIKLEDLIRGSDLFGIAEKRDFLFKTLKMPPELTNYIISRINYFFNNIK